MGKVKLINQNRAGEKEGESPLPPPARKRRSEELPPAEGRAPRPPWGAGLRSLSKRRPLEKGGRRLGVSTCGAVSRRRWCPHPPAPTLQAVIAHLDFAYRLRRSPSSSTRRRSRCAVEGYRGCARNLRKRTKERKAAKQWPLWLEGPRLWGPPPPYLPISCFIKNSTKLF